MGKTYTVKILSGDFKVTTPEISLLSQLAVTSKGIPVPYTNLQLNRYPNTQLDLFCSVNFSFWCTAPSTWLTNCANPSTRLQSPTRKSCWLQSSSVHPNDKDQEDAWSQNPMVHKHSNFFTRKMNQGKFSLRSQFVWTNFTQHLCNLCHLWRPLKYSFYMSTVVRKESPNT